MNYSSDLEPDDEKYSLSPDNGLWTEQCIRIIGDNERPLVLQKFWKPSEGYARRFELRRRSDLLIIEDKDTSGVNANVRRLLTSKVKCESGASSVDSQSELDSVQGCTDEEVTSRKFARDTRPTLGAQTHNIELARTDTRSEQSRSRHPNTCPFLVNVHGYNPKPRLRRISDKSSLCQGRLRPEADGQEHFLNGTGHPVKTLRTTTVAQRKGQPVDGKTTE